MKTRDPMCARTRVLSVAVALSTSIASVGGTGGFVHKEMQLTSESNTVKTN